MEKHQLTPETESLINRHPAPNRAHNAAEVTYSGQTRLSFWLQPRLHTWIETHLLDPSGWTWRHFTEAALGAVLSPNWVHPTWHRNYDARGVGNRPLDTSRMIGWTPFLDEVPQARVSIAGIAPYVNPRDERARLPSQVGTRSQGADIRYESSQAPRTGQVTFDWFQHTHVFCATLGTLTPLNNMDTHQSKDRRRIRAMSASEVVKQAINAHFEPNGVPALRECAFQVWREYCAMRGGYQDHYPTTAQVFERLKRAELIKSDAPRVELWAATLGEHMTLSQQYESGMWPEKILRRFSVHV